MTRTPRPSRLARTAVTSSAVSLLLLTTACGGGGSDKAGGEGDGKPVTITYWSATTGAKETVDAFNKTHHDVKVKFSLVPSGPDGVTKLTNAVKAGNAPDVTTMDYSELPEFAGQGNLQDLSGAAGAFVKAKFPDNMQSLVNLGGKTWAVPFDVTPLELFYRKDLFKKFGVAVPTTWAEYRKAAEKIHKADPSVRITNFGGGDPALLAGLAWQAGAHWYSISGDAWKVDIDDAASRKVAAYWDGLLKDDLASKTPLWSKDETSERANGKVATVIGAAWSASGFPTNYPALKGKWGIAPLPTWDGRAATGMYGGTSYVVPKGSAHRDADVEFIKWVTTDPAAMRARLSSQKLPSSALPANRQMQAVAEKAYDGSYFPGQDVYKLAENAAATIVPGWTWGPVHQQVNSAQNATGADHTKSLTVGQATAEKSIEARGMNLAK
ncbi:ABC transporter substrate-binding protein [Streptomyces beihaiensis]|uniref:Sugar ABC transporter substrate-binding protein n=1 Tax=Streptomyces beihaiensis TaxID=2984495 RepID=A0ABT3U021_9ACTN|nr:sugar ABC transporter substrate-binding protein [Streptomyces beihaiensis]MCX3062662.1 sugar ABC transporter substrate-binding protein [Streptomyces beihaiensis]